MNAFGKFAGGIIGRIGHCARSSRHYLQAKYGEVFVDFYSRLAGQVDTTLWGLIYTVLFVPSESQRVITILRRQYTGRFALYALGVLLVAYLIQAMTHGQFFEFGWHFLAFLFTSGLILFIHWFARLRGDLGLLAGYMAISLMPLVFIAPAHVFSLSYGLGLFETIVHVWAFSLWLYYLGAFYGLRRGRLLALGSLSLFAPIISFLLLLIFVIGLFI